MKKIIGSIVGCSVLAFALAGFAENPSSAQKTAIRTDRNSASVENISLSYLRDRAAFRGTAQTGEFKTQKVDFDDLQMAHTRFQQTINGVPVWGGEAIVHLQSDNSLSSVTDEMKDVATISTSPVISEKEAVKRAVEISGIGKFLTKKPQSDLWIFPAENGTHLAYRVSLHREDGSPTPSMPVIFIDANTGEKIFEYDNLQTGSGNSLYSGTVNVGTSSANGTYYLENLTRKVGTFNYNNGTSTAARFTDADDYWDSAVQRAGVDAQFGAEATMNYFQAAFNRNGIDGSGGPGNTTAAANSSVGLITSRVHYSSRYNNAFWNGSYMTYGDGDGSTFTPLVTLDICGHEMTHGVTERTANLIYSNESGALNESMSDVFGTLVERYARSGNWNWKIGEDAYTPSNGTGDALRYMDTPNTAGDPDHYAIRYTGTSDNGGVHTNSGIANNAFFLASQGGTNRYSNISAPGIGIDNAAKVWYRALTTYMTSSTNFAGARTATINAANDLYGANSTQSNGVAQAWCAVGVGTCPTGGTPTPTPTTTPTPSGSELIVNGNLETSLSPWVSSGSGALYTSNGANPYNGTGYMYFGTANSVTGQTYQTVTIPSTATGTLSFYLNVTSNESTTSTQYDKLYVEVRSTSGTLLTTLATYSNLNKASSGTAYTLRTASLAAYKGQTVNLQFRAVTDSSQPTTFRVDGVSLK